jgi:hypothetical protein
MKIFKILTLTAAFIGLQSPLTKAQNSNSVPLGDVNHYAMDRLMIRNSDFGGLAPTLHPYRRSDVRQYLDYMRQKGYALTRDSSYLLNDNNDEDSSIASRKPFLKYLYRTPAHFYEVRVPHFYLNINPMLDIEGGMEQYNGENHLIMRNRRGLQLRGNIDGKVYFYTDIIESQASFPTYINNRVLATSAVPGAGFYKTYDSQFTPTTDDGVDFLMSQGYIGFNATRFIGVQLGHGRNFIGDGHRSLLLSDYSNNYFYLKFDTRVWRIHYQNLFAELTQDHAAVANNVYEKKYMATHNLSINILKNLNVGLFESVIFDRAGRGFELQYLNPLILYRTVEQMLGSPDNVIMGMTWRYDFLKRFSFYGQVLIDEFVFSKVFARKGDPEAGWWANKQGIQAGLKYVDVAGLQGLDLQLEFNTVRPYTYTFRDSSANYTHYNQPLAHPMGANFREFIAIVRYSPIKQLQLRAQLNYATHGLDTLGSNWGSNIHLPYTTYEREFGNVTAQGVKTNLMIGQFIASYMPRHNLFVDLTAMYRREDAVLDALDNNTLIVSLGLRWNMAARMNDW